MVIIMVPGMSKSVSAPAAHISFQWLMVSTKASTGTPMSSASSSRVSALKAFSLWAAAIQFSLGP